MGFQFFCSFSLNDYLTFKNIDDFEKHFDLLRSMDGEKKAIWGFSDNLAIMEKHLLAGLRKVAQGEEWIDVPFDWGPYK